MTPPEQVLSGNFPRWSACLHRRAFEFSYFRHRQLNPFQTVRILCAAQSGWSREDAAATLRIGLGCEGGGLAVAGVNFATALDGSVAGTVPMHCKSDLSLGRMMRSASSTDRGRGGSAVSALPQVDSSRSWIQFWTGAVASLVRRSLVAALAYRLQ